MIASTTFYVDLLRAKAGDGTKMINNEKELWVFLSHSNKDFDKVRRIRNYLEEHSCRPLMFYLMCLSNDDEIDLLIKREIDCRTRFIICSSENAKASRWVQSEVNYIKSCRKSFDVIDLAESDETIRNQLDAFLKSTQVFLLFCQEDTNFVWEVFSHIKKYDMRIVGGFGGKDISSPQELSSKPEHGQRDSFEGNMHILSEFGFIVFFASKEAMQSDSTKVELGKLIKDHVAVFSILLDKYASEHFQKYFSEWQLGYDARPHSGGLPDRRKLTVVDVSQSKNKLEDAIEGIVNRAFPCWDTYTMAENFLRGIDGKTDEGEAERLFRIAYRRADALDSVGYPGGTLYLAKCEANGYGTKKDLEAAIIDYHNYLSIMCSASPELETEICAVEDELNKGLSNKRYSHRCKII